MTPHPRNPNKDRGSMTVEAVLIVPIMVVLTLLVVQVAMYWHGRQLAQQAAQQGVIAASGYRSSGAAAGQQVAAGYVEAVAPRLLQDVVVSANAGSGQVAVTIQAQVLSIVPWVELTVDVSAAGPAETVGDTP